MKIKINPEKQEIEIETQDIPAFCLKCGLLIGSIDIIKGSDHLSYMLMNPLCSKCFAETGIKPVEPKIAL